MPYLAFQELTKYGAPIDVLEQFTEEQHIRALGVANSEADTFLAGPHETPLSTFPAALKQHVFNAYMKHLYSGKGRSMVGDDKQLDDDYKSAIAFYKAIQQSKQKLPGNVTSPSAGPIVHAAGSASQDDTYRGW